MAGELPGAVRRTRLLSRLSGVPADVPVVLLVAPPGYGKTTVLRQWLGAEADIAWVGVEEEAGSGVRLLDRVLLALAEVAPLGQEVARALQSPVLSVLVPRLAAALRTRTRPLLVVLDDVQEVPAAELDAVVALAGALPPGGHLVVTARHTRNLPLGALRARGAVFELGTADLALTAEEATQVLTAAGVECTPEQVRELTSRTEGWPVAVYLATATAQRSLARAEVPVPVAAVIEYLCDEVLDRLDEETVAFLLRSSVLEELSGPLCEAVLGAGAGARLADAVERNLFLRPLDDRGEWYGYHRLVREALRVELRHREPPAESAVLARAAQWCARHARPQQAVDYALRGGHVPLAAAVVATHAHRLAAAGRLATVRGWLDAFSDNDVRAEPAVAVVAAWVWGLSGAPARATSALLAAERAAAGPPPPDGCASLESALLTARAALAPRGVERMLTDAQRAFELEPAGSPWRPVAAVLLGCARRLNGLESEAAWPLELAAETGRDHQPWAAQLALAQRSLLAADADDWNTAASCADAAVSELRRRPEEDNPAAVLVHAAAARVAERGDDHAAARNQAGSAVAVSGTFPGGFPWLSAQAGLVLGWVYLHLGDTDGARQRIDEVRRHLVRLPTEGVLRARLEDLSKAWALAGTDVRSPVPPLSPAELSVLRLLRTHLSLGEIADELHVSRNTVKSQVASLYRKLDASSRSQALRRGAELGLG